MTIPYILVGHMTSPYTLVGHMTIPYALVGHMVYIQVEQEVAEVRHLKETAPRPELVRKQCRGR